jgi:hypothetical protein
MYLGAYQQAKNLPKMAEAANELMSFAPKDVQTHAGLITLALQANNTAPEMLDIVEKASKGVIANIDNKPANVTDEQWKTQRNQLLGYAYKSLGYVAQQRKNTQGMVENYTKSLEADPNQGSLSYALGQAILGEKDETTYPVGLFHVARAVVYEGPNALAAADRKKIDDYLQKAYQGFHGDPKGLEDVKKVAKTNAVPPPGWTIKSVKEIAQEKIEAEKKLAEENPSLALWRRIKEGLNNEGQAYYDQYMKDALIENLSGYLVEQRGKELVLAMSGKDAGPEVTLELDTPMPNKAEPGTELQFAGVAKSFSKEPFMLTMDAERKNIKGWPAPAPKKPARRRR